jgi:hypothetical protein
LHTPSQHAVFGGLFGGGFGIFSKHVVPLGTQPGNPLSFVVLPVSVPASMPPPPVSAEFESALESPKAPESRCALSV